VTRRQLNFAGVQQADYAISLIVTLNAFILIRLMGPLGTEPLVYFILCIALNILPPLASDYWLSRVALEPKVVEMR